jgi:hypothetical protein
MSEQASASPEGQWLSPLPSPPLTGVERFKGLDQTVSGFWQFAMSDLRMNNTRGYLAEFLVARAVGAPGLRIEWDEYDVLAPDGLRIEVKASAYLQNWEQRNLSRIQFSGLSRRSAPTGDGLVPRPPTYHADVYVFAVQTATNHAEYDPLDVAQWEFYVLPRQAIVTLGQRSIGLATLTGITGGPLTYKGLADAIRAAGKSPAEAGT